MIIEVTKVFDHCNYQVLRITKITMSHRIENNGMNSHCEAIARVHKPYQVDCGNNFEIQNYNVKPCQHYDDKIFENLFTNQTKGTL